MQKVESQIMTATEKLNSIRPHLDMVGVDDGLKKSVFFVGA